VKAIKRLKRNKSLGTGIDGEAIQAGGIKLAKFAEKAWQEGKIPEDWTRSILVKIRKKGDLTECSNYTTIALMNHMCKVLMVILFERLKPQVEAYLAEEQARFRRDRNTTQQILMLRLLAEEMKRNGTVSETSKEPSTPSVTCATMKSYGVGRRLTQMLQVIGGNTQFAVRVGQDMGEWFISSIGTRQGDPLSPTTVITYLER